VRSIALRAESTTGPVCCGRAIAVPDGITPVPPAIDSSATSAGTEQSVIVQIFVPESALRPVDATADALLVVGLVDVALGSVDCGDNPWCMGQLS
jgi:hypothetical protein